MIFIDEIKRKKKKSIATGGANDVLLRIATEMMLWSH